jgi:hypothetical protein
MVTNARAAQAGAMAARFVDAEPATELLERRWFAALAAVKSLQAECDVLLGVLEQSADAWRRACAQLAQLEALRDALGNQLAAVDEPRAESRDTATLYEVNFASRRHTNEERPRSEHPAVDTHRPAAIAARSSGTGCP